MKRHAVRRKFRLKSRHLKDWARDQANMARDFFGTQTPLIAIAKSIDRDAGLSKAVRRALSREFHGRVKFSNEISKGWRCEALSVTAETSKCSRCGEAAKTLKTNFAFLDHGKVVPTPEMHATPAVCPGCGHVEEPANPAVEAAKDVDAPGDSRVVAEELESISEETVEL